jgi:uncharacterized protein (TIGR03437 family)
MRRSHGWVVWAILAAYSPAWAQGPAPDPRGIFVYSEHLQQDAQQLLQALTVPGTDGITLLQGWRSFEPDRGSYNWTELDKWMSTAISSGKKVTLAIRAGQDTPCWLFQAPQCGAGYSKPYAGATPITFQVSARQGVGQSQCNSATIAAPWDPVFLSEWDSMLAALAAHLKSAGTYNAVTSVRLTGVNRTTAELRLPEEILTTPCATNSIQTWLQASPPYRPARLLQAWDTITSSFQKSFPDKFFGLEVVPDGTGNNSYPLPEIDDNGCIYSSIVSPSSAPTACINTAPLPDQIAPLVLSANQKFLGRLAVSFQNLDLTAGANPYPVQAAQTLGTAIGYQTNDYNNLQTAACSGGFLNPGPCTSATYLALLEVGVYPLGKTNSLRAQYIEVLPPDAISYQDAILQAHLELIPGAVVPQINSGGIVNNASYGLVSAAVAPGSIAAIFGTNLTDGSSCVGPACNPTFGVNGKLGTTMAGAQVSVNGTPVPIFYAVPTQLGVQIPFEVFGSSATVAVVVGGDANASTAVNIAPAAPGIFTLAASGQGPGAVTHVNGSVVSAQSPAQRNEVLVIYATGLGQVAPAVSTGVLPTGASSTVTPVTVTIGGITVIPDFAGLAGCCVGLNQINVGVPAGVAPSGAVPVVVNIGGKSSNTATIAVQ